MDISISGSGFDRRCDRFASVGQTGCSRGEALSTEKLCKVAPRPRVINVDGNPSYPKAIAELKKTGELGRRCRCRPIRYLNNIVEQDHRAIKRRVRASQGFRSFRAAARTIQGLEMMNIIRKGQVRWLAKGDIVGQVVFITGLLELDVAA